MIHLNNFKSVIIDIFEDFLEEKGVTIENDEHSGDEGEAIIYGSDYDWLMYELTRPLAELAKKAGAGESDISYDTWEASYYQPITLSHKTVEKLTKALNWKDGDPEDDRFDEDYTWIATADFGNGVCMDIKVCGVQYDCPGGCNSAWSEAVLFKDGVEQCCTDPGDDLLGDWELMFDDEVYKVTVKEEDGLGLNHIGTIDIPDGKVDVTDPCYNRSVWCRMNDVKVTPGTYDCFADIVDGSYGRRVARCIIRLENLDGFYSAREIGEIGVDAGIAGFFVEKPDFSDEDWQELCNSMFRGTGKYVFEASLGDDAFVCGFDGKPGFWTTSGFGDGGYPVFAYYKEGHSLPVGLCITFIEEGEEDDYE